MNNVDSEFLKLLQDLLNQALKHRGKVTILIAGKTGVGKSTLINTVFQGEVAATGQGKPVTKHTREYSKEGIPLTILDTRGLEVADYKETMQQLERIIRERSNDEDPSKHVHVAWVCIVEDTHRVEDAEAQLVEMLARNNIPTLAVITKAKADNGFSKKVQELLPEVRNVTRVRAKEIILDDGYELAPMGLENLVKLTMELVPESVKNAFVAAQRISLDLKINRSHAVVAAAALSAGGVGAAPVPFSDAVAIIPIQVSMLATISAIWGLPTSVAFLATLVSGSIVGSAGTFLGRVAVGALLKFIPGAGSVVGGTVSGVTAGLLTTA
ncbi:MAG: GTP-binding protein, partial [Anaerolineales bacterium]|nr:GTP-binding protein [Anaerolineales bacterium]